MEELIDSLVNILGGFQMGISSISSASGSTYINNDTSQAERQKANIMQQIQQEKSSKDDDKTKQVKIAKLELQLSQVQSSQVINQEVQPSQNAASDSTVSNKQDSSDSILHEYA